MHRAISVPCLISRFVGSAPRICSRLVRELKTALRHNQSEHSAHTARTVLSVRQSLCAHLRGVRMPGCLSYVLTVQFCAW